MPVAGPASKPFKRLVKKRTHCAKPCRIRPGAGYAHVIHRAFPTDWGQLATRLDAVSVGAACTLRAKPCELPLAAVCPRLLHRVIHRLIRRETLPLQSQSGPRYRYSNGIDQNMIKPRQALNTKACNRVPPCCPQAVPHDPWTSFYLCKQGLGEGFEEAKSTVCDKLSTFAERRGRMAAPDHQWPPR